MFYLNALEGGGGSPSPCPRDARVLYIHGKALNALPEFSKEAYLLLSQAVKLDPSVADAWAAAGCCLVKKEECPYFTPISPYFTPMSSYVIPYFTPVYLYRRKIIPQHGIALYVHYARDKAKKHYSYYLWYCVRSQLQTLRKGCD